MSQNSEYPSQDFTHLHPFDLTSNTTDLQMIDVIKISSTKPRVFPHALALAAASPLYQKRLVQHSRAFDATLAIVQFGNNERRFVTLKLLVRHGVATRMVGFEANLPTLLFGHNGRTIKSQLELLTALTILRFLLAQFVHPDDVRLILPSRDVDNDAHIVTVECPLQLQDPGAEMLLAAHLSDFRNFVKTPRVYPGESILFRSSGMDVCIYDKAAETKEGSAVPEGIHCTRVEVRFKTARRLLEALGFGQPGTWVTAAASFDSLNYAFVNAIRGSLVGALAEPSGAKPKQLKRATRSILALARDAVSMQAALAELQGKKSHDEFGKIRREVLHALSRRYPISLPARTQKWPADGLSEISIPNLEAAHERLKVELGWPTEPAEDVAQTFAGLLVHKKAKPWKKAFFPDNEP